MKTCHLCGHPLPARRWHQLPRQTCRDLDGCRERFVAAFMAGRVSPPTTPTGRWVR